ncbi:MAG: matrixin family metalloprotease [Deltaproteobacteria bacterium]|nr:matrixin family metalloprotease [Deltaproteobacteria bacterium]MBI3016695.1 matrixin family metalloprotease [Deltaproteobacteria bacterium]
MLESELGQCDAAISSAGYLLSSDCRPLSWGRKLPVYLKYGTSMTEDARQAFDEAIRIWNDALGFPILQVIDRSTPDPIGSENDPSTHLIGMRSGTNWTQCDQSVMICGGTDEPAKTIYHYSEFLVDTDIMINQSFNLSFQYHPQKYDLTSIALHELGHVLGLDHDDTTTPQISIMNRSISEGIQRGLSARDIQRVRTLYGL